MLCYHGKLSVICFLIAVIIAFLPELLLRLGYHLTAYFGNIWLVHAFLFGVLNVVVIIIFQGFPLEVALRAVLLGYVFTSGILLTLTAPESWKVFGIYTVVLATFHYSEFLSIAFVNPSSLTVDSFILNHSTAYGIAAFSSWFEFVVERYLFPESKLPSAASYFGVALCITGEILRKLAMFTARENFNHIVQNERADGHELITHGVYQLCRHPSYMGWFYWSIGTQLILQNPLCLLAYIVASWSFFKDRILIEEITLLNFFGQDYIEYQKQVGTGLPFISGYKVNL